MLQGRGVGRWWQAGEAWPSTETDLGTRGAPSRVIHGKTSGSHTCRWLPPAVQVLGSCECAARSCSRSIGAGQTQPRRHLTSRASFSQVGIGTNGTEPASGLWVAEHAIAIMECVLPSCMQAPVALPAQLAPPLLSRVLSCPTQ